MSQLIYLRQRLKAIETIKKITHAMRLISMSSHTRMRVQDVALKAYISAADTLLAKITAHSSTFNHPFINSSSQPQSKELVIVVGSQKGLCGSFNTTLLNFFFAQYQDKMDTIEVIVIGKKLIDVVKEKKIKTSAEYSELHLSTLSTIAGNLVAHITSVNPAFHTVTIVSNLMKSFFVQKPHQTQLIPFKAANKNIGALTENYHWEQSPEEIMSVLITQILQSNIHYTLFQSLYAEQAARFLSMDNSTRNAQTLLDQTKLQYNKLRQAKITKELTELTGNF